MRVNNEPINPENKFLHQLFFGKYFVMFVIIVAIIAYVPIYTYEASNKLNHDEFALLVAKDTKEVEGVLFSPGWHFINPDKYDFKVIKKSPDVNIYKVGKWIIDTNLNKAWIEMGDKYGDTRYYQ